MRANEICQQAAYKYLERGWKVIPIPPRQKNPIIKNWQNLHLTQEEVRQFFSTSCNLGVLLGEPSGWLVDIDIDHPLAAQLAGIFLPTTGAIFGRASKPASHWVYISPEAKTKKWQYGGTVLVELRSSGAQTIFPPSTHPSGETVEWASEGEPRQVSKEVLEQACAKLAAATLLALSWPAEGTRQDTALALTGALLRAGWGEEEVKEFILAVAGAAGDEETRKRAETVAYTARKLGTSPTTGWPRLSELLGEDVTKKLRDWLAIREDQPKVPVPEVRLWTAQELLEANFPEPSWLIPGLLPEGGLVLLAGKPKVGKSWLALDIAHGLSSGGTVCGVPVARQVNTLYLALEDTPKRLKNRLVLAGLTPDNRCFLTTSWPRINAVGLGLLEKTITEHNIGVVIVDTLAKVRPREDKAVSLYTADYETLGSLKELADRLGTSPTTGWPRLAELLSEEVVKKVKDWLNIREIRENRTPQAQQVSEIKLWTAQELLSADFPQPVWLVPGLLPEGGLVLLAGKPKIGKSWLALDIAFGLSSETAVCGIPVARQVNTLYLALEDTPRRLKNRMVLAGVTSNNGCFLATSWPRINAVGLGLLEKTVTERNVGVVIIDTLAKVRPRADRAVSLYTADYETLGSLKELADRLGVTVIVVHHLRKAGSVDPIEEVSGTTGLTGAVDTVLVLKRGRGEADGTLFLTGRDVEERELALRFSNGRWTVLGDAKEYTVSKERRQVLEFLQAAKEPLGIKEIAAVLQKPEPAVRMLLSRMVQDGLLRRVERGRYAVAVLSPPLSYISYKVT